MTRGAETQAAHQAVGTAHAEPGHTVVGALLVSAVERGQAGSEPSPSGAGEQRGVWGRLPIPALGPARWAGSPRLPSCFLTYKAQVLPLPRAAVSGTANAHTPELQGPAHGRCRERAEPQESGQKRAEHQPRPGHRAALGPKA